VVFQAEVVIAVVLADVPEVVVVLADVTVAE